MTERQLLASTYHDRADIYRSGAAENPDTAQMEPFATQVAAGVVCALSQSKSGSHTVSDGAGSTSESHVLFCDPAIDITAGDRLEITTATGRAFTLWAGQPFVYVSHAEIPLTGEQRS
ncbi:MAG: hypothetical protein ACK5L0_04835 [Candidatus Fimivivens sp.]